MPVSDKTIMHKYPALRMVKHGFHLEELQAAVTPLQDVYVS